MENFIKVFDDIVPKNISNSIEQWLIYSQECKWNYSSSISNKSNDSTDGYYYCFFSIADSKKRSGDQREDMVFFLTQPLYSLTYHLGLQVFKCYESRAFLQKPQGKNIESLDGIHVDLVDRNKKLIPHWVCLYYVNDSDGDTIFFDENNKEIQRVSPKKGRIAFFDGAIPHCTTTPKDDIRTVLNFDFQGGYI